MTQYNCPQQDMLFLVNEFLEIQNYSHIQPIQNASADILPMLLEEAGKLSAQTLLPLNDVGDQEGCILKEAHVKTPTGFKEAYALFCENGWGGLNCREEDGGQNMPLFVGSFVNEIMSACNMAFAMYPGLSHGAYSAIATHGTEAQKDYYLPLLTSGQWTGTMNLTEPHAGTDLGLLRTKAVPQEDGTYKVSGQKIFISSGDHDLADNIIHLVLARTPEAPEGVKGLSLFIVPKILEDGTKNTLQCSKLEEKMGIHGNATCVMDYDDATGYLLGDLHKGLRAMFTMMNEARLGVGIQGLSQSEIAYQNALSYAKDRTQGRAISGTKNPDKSADAIIHHADIRRILMDLKAFNEGARAFIADVSLKIDLSHYEKDDALRKAYDDYASLMTPIVKGYITDKAFALCVEAQQVFGGHGYIKEWGVEQFVRDARIAMIYEGANGIQALDLVGRKMGQNNGQTVIGFLKEIKDFMKSHPADEALKELYDSLNKSQDILQKICMYLMKISFKDPEAATANATYVLHAFGIVTLQYMWLKMAVVSQKKTESFYQDKVKTAQYFTKHFVPDLLALEAKIYTGKDAYYAIDFGG